MSPRRLSREPAVPKNPKFVDATDPVISCKDKEVTPTQQGHINIGVRPTVEDPVPVVKGMVEDIVPEQLISQAALLRAKESLVAAQTCIEDAKQTIFAVDGIDDDSVPGTKARGLTPVDSPKEETETPELQGDSDAGVGGDEESASSKDITPVLPGVAEPPPVSDSDEKRKKPGKSEPNSKDIVGVSKKGGTSVDGSEVGVETTGESETEANEEAGGVSVSAGEAPNLGEDPVNGGSRTATENEENKDGPTFVVSPSSDQKTKPRKYKPGIRKPRALRAKTETGSNDVPKTQRSLGIRLQLELDKRERIIPTLLLTKGSSALTSLSVFNVQTGAAMETEEYGDNLLTCSVKEYGTLLRDGLKLEHRENSSVQVKWLLSGRNIYILGRPPDNVDISGWIQTPRVCPKQKHMVLCTNEIREDVLGLITSTQAHQPVEHSLEDTVFGGWTLYNDVEPEHVVESDRDGTIFDVLKPRASVDIVLEGGNQVERSVWLKSGPPNIKISAETDETDENVFIDGNFAERDGDGCYSVNRCFEVGVHVVQTADVTKKYSIEEPEWVATKRWKAHSFPMFSNKTHSSHVYFCGPLVWCETGVQETEAVIVPENVRVLVGANPGEILVCSSPSTGQAGTAVGFPNFSPCWALPENPLRASRTKDMIFCFPSESDLPSKSNLQNLGKQEQIKLKTWSYKILEASYRKLKLGSGGAAAAADWNNACKLAKQVRRKFR